MMVNVFLGSLMFLILLSNVNAYAIRAKRQITYCPSPMPGGTTPNFEQIFLGRCWEFQYLYSSHDNCPGQRVDCSDALQKFKAAFVGKDPCNIADNAYDELLGLIPIQFADDMTLFWSGTNELAHGYSDASSTIYTLEDSMLAYMTNGLNWCGSEGSDQFSSDPCPEYDPDTCTHTATGVFWSSASTMLARQASGIATVMINGSSPWQAFYDGSFFAKYELPNLDTDKVTNLRIVVAHDVGGPIKEECGTDSVKTLEDLVATRGLVYTCEDSPRDIRFLQCVDNLDHRECQQFGPRIWRGIGARWFQ